MLRREISFGMMMLFAAQVGCGGDSAPPAASAPVAAPPSGSVGAAPAEAEAEAAPGDIYAAIPDSATGGAVIRVPKLLASPFAKSDAATKLIEGLRNDWTLDAAQIDEAILVFMGGSGTSGYPSGSPSSEREGGSPYGPPGSSSPYGPPASRPAATAASGDAAQQGMMTAMTGMMPAAETTVRIARASVAIDQAKIRELKKLEATETTSGLYKYFRSQQPDGDAICFFDDKTLIVGRESTLQSFFTAQTTTPSAGGSPYGPPAAATEEAEAAPVEKKLGDKLREAAPELTLFGIVKGADAQGSTAATPLAMVAGPGMNPASMMSAVGASLPPWSYSIDLTSGAKLTADLAAPNAEMATALWSNLQIIPGTIGTAIGLQRIVAPPHDSPDQKAVREKVFDAMEQLAKTMKVDRGGENNLHVLITGSLDQPMVEGLAGMMKRDLLVPPGSATARLAVESQMKQLGVAAHGYLSANSKLPTAATMSADGKPLLSWRVALLPFLGQKELYDQFKLDEPWDSEHNKTLVQNMPAVYAVPGVSEPGKTALLAPIGEGAVFAHKEGATLAMASDGPSNTILLVQANPDRAVVWTAPDDLKFDPAKPTDGLDSAYPGVFMALWLDGQVHSIALNTAKATSAALFTYAGGETVDLAALVAAASAAPTSTSEGGEASATAVAATTSKTYAPGWAGDAQRAIDRGHDKEAARLALAAAIVAEDEVLTKDVMHWSKLARPVHVLRWGVGVMPDPKRRAEPLGGAGGVGGAGGNPYGRGFGAASSGESGGDDEEADPNQEFNDLAGEVGSDMIKELRERLDDGDFGKLFEYDRKRAAEGDDANSAASRMRLETSGSPYGPGARTGTGNSTTPTTDAEAEALAESAPRGLTILGKGDRKKLLAAAAEAEVDILLIAEMTTKNTRSTDPAVRWVMVDVATKKKIDRESDPIPLPSDGNSSFGPSNGGDRAALANNDADARRKNTTKWLKTLDQAMKFKEVPDLTGEKVADKVLKQAAKMVGAGGQENPLPVLLELRYYQVLGALKPEDALPLVQKVVKDEEKAKALVSGSIEERKSVLEAWLLPVPDGAAPAKSGEDADS